MGVQRSAAGSTPGRGWWPRSTGRGTDGLVVLRSLRHLGLAWVCLTVPVVTWVSAGADTPTAYLFVFVFLSCGLYTTPGLVFGLYAVWRAPAEARTGFALLYVGLASVYLIGVGMLVGLATGWRAGNNLGLAAVAVSGAAHTAGLAFLVRTRSGRRALSVDIVEALAVVVAVVSPLVVLWGPAVVGADHAWFTVPAALVLVSTVSGVYWTAVLCVRLGPRVGPFLLCALALACVGTVNVALQTAQGVSDFSWPAPPLIALNCLTVSMYLLVPLYAPELLPPGLGRLPPQDQVRGARLATFVALAGIVVLLAATATVADERPWAVAFALGVVSVLFVLAAVRQLAAFGETRRLYRQVELASEERGRLLTQMLEGWSHDRRRFARQLHEQAITAAASFATLSGVGVTEETHSPMVAQASALMRGELGRHADALAQLVVALRAREGQRPARGRLTTPIAAHFSSVYGDGPAPDLAVEVAEDLVLDWVTETVVLHIVHEALHNVWRHSTAATVTVAIGTDGDAVAVRVTDDGVGFTAASAPEGAGIASMRSSAAVVGGTVAVTSIPDAGTTVAARLPPAADLAAEPPPASPPPTPPRPSLRLVPGPPAGRG